jgi:hypothetical protein
VSPGAGPAAPLAGAANVLPARAAHGRKCYIGAKMRQIFSH